LNPERSIPDENNNQQVFIGVSLPVGKGLFIDDRRATLNQAKVFANQTEFERIKVINKILLQAAKDYWSWYYAYFRYRLFLQSISIAEEIFDRVTLNYELGEAAVVDTIQASITLQNRINEARMAEIELIQSRLMLSNYFWDDQNNPLYMDQTLAPDYLEEDFFMIEETALGALLRQAESNHPEIRKLDYKLEQINIKNRLAKENLKPELNLSYGWIDEPITGVGEGNGFTFDENYKFGLDFSFPLLLRKERSKVQLNELQALQVIFERDLRRREIINDVNGIYFQIVNSVEIMNDQWEIAESYRRLVEAEYLNLESGESDLFKINIQQDKYIESFDKGLKTRVNVEKARAELYWAAGVQNLDPNF
jgi:outer membrane protein TolC